MACYKPLTGYRSRDPNDKRIKFKPSEGYHDQPLSVPCGKCIGCIEARSREWALRCVNEAQMHPYNSFLTLTYNDKNLPDYGSLSKRDLQLFFKNLRIYITRNAESLKLAPDPIKYFASGEYGNKSRPHYHICLFGWDFPDRKPWSVKNGNVLYRSKTLEKIWTNGFSTIGEVSFESAAYVARYTTKKLSRKGEDKFSIDLETGEIIDIEQEFCLMSRDPGLGNKWVHIYLQDCRKDFLMLNGYAHPIPRYYKNIMKELDPKQYKLNQERRRQYVIKHKHELTYPRQKAKTKIKKAQFTLLRGNLE